jgi:hypothetical protein
MHDDAIVFHNHTAGECVSGAAAVRAHIAAIFARWPTLRFMRRTLRCGADFAASEWTARASRDGRPEELRLGAGVVEVALRSHVVPREGEQARDGIPIRPVPRRRHSEGPGRVGRDELDLHALRLRRRGGTVVRARVEDLGQSFAVPGRAHPQVEESRRRDLRLGHAVERGRHLPQGLRDLQRRAALLWRCAKSRVRRVVAVLGLSGALERHGDAEAVLEAALDATDRFGRHGAIS